MRARSALFDEAGTDIELGAWPSWIGVYLLAGLVFAALYGYLAVTSGLSPVPWFFAGLIGNLAALLVLLAARRSGPAFSAPSGLAKVPRTVAPVAC